MTRSAATASGGRLVNGNQGHTPTPPHATQHPWPSDPKSTVHTTLPLFAEAKGAQAQLKNSGRQLFQKKKKFRQAAQLNHIHTNRPSITKHKLMTNCLPCDKGGITTTTLKQVHIAGMYQQQHSHCANHSLLSEITTSTIFLYVKHAPLGGRPFVHVSRNSMNHAISIERSETLSPHHPPVNLRVGSPPFLFLPLAFLFPTVLPVCQLWRRRCTVGRWPPAGEAPHRLLVSRSPPCLKTSAGLPKPYPLSFSSLSSIAAPAASFPDAACRRNSTSPVSLPSIHHGYTFPSPPRPF